MYFDELRHEPHHPVLSAMRRWDAATRTLEGALTRLRRLLAVDRSDAAATFHLHRAPETDALRW